MKIVKRVVLIIILLFLVAVASAVAIYASIPRGNTSQAHFDTIIVLGCPSNPDGSPSPTERKRVLEGVGEYRRGVAPRLIMTGAAAHNKFVEADVMARFAVAQGVPADAVIEETHAHDTVQNAFYSVQIMQEHG